MERAGEFVLMNVGRSVQPKEDLNVKAGMIECDQLGLTKSGLALKRLVVITQELMNHLFEIHVLRRRCFVDRDASTIGNRFERKILLLPTFEDGAAKLIKIGIQERTLFCDQLHSREDRLSRGAWRFLQGNFQDISDVDTFESFDEALILSRCLCEINAL